MQPKFFKIPYLWEKSNPMSEEPIEEPVEEKDPPVGGAGGHHPPKERRTYGKLPGLTRRKTYHVVIAIPSIQLAIIFLTFLIATTDFYKVSYPYMIQLTGVSLLTCVYYWYASKFMGSCISALVSIYTLALLNIVNVIYIIFDFDYYLYGTIITGAGLLFSIPFLRILRRRTRQSKARKNF